MYFSHKFVITVPHIFIFSLEHLDGRLVVMCSFHNTLVLMDVDTICALYPANFSCYLGCGASKPSVACNILKSHLERMILLNHKGIC